MPALRTWTGWVGVTAALVTAAPRLDAVDLHNVLTGYAVASWADGDGRPLGPVNAIVQDRDGYLWIGTDSGLLRFDGSRFARWDTLSPTALPPLPVTALFASHDGTLWVGFRDRGIIRRISSGALQPDKSPADARGLVTDIAEDAMGTVWAVIGARLYEFRGDVWRAVPLPVGPPVTVVSVSTTRNGSLLVGTTTALFERDPDAGSFRLVRRGWTWDAWQDGNGTLWVTDTSTGLRRADGKDSSLPMSHLNGFRLLQDRVGNLWLATIGEGLWRARPAQGSVPPTLERASLYTGLLSDSVQSLLEDREGNVWVGTTGGLHKLTRRRMTPMVDVGLAIATETTGADGIWVGTGDGLIRLRRTATATVQLRPATSAALYIRALHRDKSGTLWVGSQQGLFRLAGSRLEPVPLPARVQSIGIITSDADGSVWLSDGSYVLRWRQNRVSPWSGPATTADDRVVLMFCDTTNRLWVALADGRVGTVDVASADFRIVEPNDLHGVHRAVYDIFEDSERVLWVLGSAGLSRSAGDRFVTLQAGSRLPTTHVGAIADDLRGNLWLNIDAGLLRLRRDAFLAAASNPSARLHYDLYETTDGVAGAPILNVRAKRGSDGGLWFVRGGGLTWTDPAVLDDEVTTNTVPIRVEDALVDDTRLAPRAATLLPAGTRRVQINYTALTLSAPNRIRFRYRLDGFDPDWVDAGSRRQAFYTNLPPRDYTFRVEATADDMTWTGNTAAWSFGIRPRVYQTRWFYALCAASAAIIAALAWQFRVRIMRQRFGAVLAERTRLAREIHDTLLQNMIGVALQFDALTETLGASSPEARHQLVRARKRVEGYVRDARQSIWDLRSPALDRRELSIALHDVAARAIQDTRVELEVKTVGTPRQASSKVENALLRIGQEAMTNAVRHGHPTRIEAELRFAPDTVTLRVHDNGSGFDVERLRAHSNGHYGLINMQERADDIEAEFTVSSAEGNGTTVEVVAPLEIPE